MERLDKAINTISDIYTEYLLSETDIVDIRTYDEALQDVHTLMQLYKETGLTPEEVIAIQKENAELKELVKIISNDVIKNKRCFNCVHNMGNVCKYHIGNLDDCSNWEHWQWQHADKLKTLGVE